MSNIVKEVINRIEKKENTPLHIAEFSAYSQNGEDGVTLEIIRRIFGSNYNNGTFFEFGVESGDQCNCAILSDILGWSGVFIESDNEYFTKLNSKYSKNDKVNTIHSIVTPENIQNLIDNSVKNIDVLSIDIDSHDYWVWKAISYSPKLVIIEYNPALQGKKVLKKDIVGSWDGTTAYGASLDAYIDLGKEKGYTLIHTDFNGVNAFFIRNDLVYLFEEANNPRIIRENKTRHPETTRDVFIDL